tara:strand:- start:955 stop:1338 length:384 start_codon:yes stop_codon:yes gene_type:complete
MAKLNVLTKLHSNDNLVGALSLNFLKEITVNVDDSTEAKDHTVTSTANYSVGSAADNTQGFYVFALNKSTSITIDINLETGGTTGAKYGAIPPGECIFIFVPSGVGIEFKTATNTAKLHYVRFTKSS